MLNIAKPILQQKLLPILKNAYMTQYEGNKVVEASKYNSESELLFQKKAQEFAMKAAGPVADAIYKFVKEIGIQVTIPPSVIAPPLPPALPGGPCSGIIPMTSFTII